MKLEFWYEDMVQFMRDASEYGSYNRELAAKLICHLPKDAHICDAGSGLGYLSLALAPHVRQVTAVEKHPAAAEVLIENCAAKGVGNVISRCGDIAVSPPEMPYDAMVFCFFGQIREILELAKAQCAGQVFLFTRNYSRHRFSAGNHASGWEGGREAAAFLEELGIPFQEEALSLEFGQPFRTLADACRFFRLYSKDADKSVLTEDFVRRQLRQTGQADFPLYMPHERKITFIRFHVKDIPRRIN